MDYKKEVDFCDKILRKNKSKSILEVGCGTGHRGQFFKSKGYDYVGLDISEGMLKIARRKYPDIRFIQGDVRKLQLKEKFDEVIFLGKGSVYLTTDDDVMAALKSMKKLIRNGVIIIDGFDETLLSPILRKTFPGARQ